MKSPAEMREYAEEMYEDMAKIIDPRIAAQLDNDNPLKKYALKNKIDPDLVEFYDGWGSFKARKKEKGIIGAILDKKSLLNLTKEFFKW